MEAVDALRAIPAMSRDWTAGILDRDDADV
jgi:hypothetical protein